MLLFVSYLLLRNPILNKSISNKQILVVLPFLFVLISSNIDADIDLLVITAAILVFSLIAYRQFSKFWALRICAFLAFSSSLIYQLVLNFSVTKDFLNALIITANNLLHPALASGLAQYHFTGYSIIENLFLITSISGMVLITILWFTLETYSIKKSGKRTIPVTYIILLFCIVYALAAVLIAPFGITTAIKMVAPVSVALSLFCIESASRRVHVTSHFFKSIEKATVIILVFCLPGFFILGGYSAYFSPLNIASYQYASTLYSSHITTFINSTSSESVDSAQEITILDSPNVPAYFVYDFLAHRIPMNFLTVELNPSIEHENYSLLNGLPAPRYTPIYLVSSTQITSLVVGTPQDVQSVVNYPDIIYSNSMICIAKNQ